MTNLHTTRHTHSSRYSLLSPSNTKICPLFQQASRGSVAVYGTKNFLNEIRMFWRSDTTKYFKTELVTVNVALNPEFCSAVILILITITLL